MGFRIYKNTHLLFYIAIQKVDGARANAKNATATDVTEVVPCNEFSRNSCTISNLFGYLCMGRTRRTMAYSKADNNILKTVQTCIAKHTFVLAGAHEYGD